MRIYNEELKKIKCPLSATSSSSSSSSLYGPSHHASITDIHSHSSQYASQISRIPVPLMFNKSKPNISMYKFINSKGKQTTNDNNAFANSFFVENEYNELRPPRFDSANQQFFRKRLSAIDKIQEELREMKLREDELKCQRVRTIGMSYPNLNSICDEDFTSDDQTVESSEENKDSFPSRYSSNPDIQQPRDNGNDSETTSDKDIKVGGPRRKIPLIEMWEQRIQKTTDIK